MLLALMKKELLALSRDLHGLAALFLMPILFIVIMSLALKDVYNPPVETIAYVVDDRDGSELARTLVREWEARHGKPQPRSDGWRDAIRSGATGYALVIEKDFAAAMLAPDLQGQGIRLRLLTDPAMEGGAFAANKAELLMLATELRGRALLAVRGAQHAPGDSAALSAQPLIEAERLAAGTRPTAVQQNVPAWLVFGMFFVVASIAGLFVEERSCGALARLRSMGAQPWQLIAGKIAPYLLVNGVQAALMLAVGVWLMPHIGGEGLSLAG